MDEYLIIQWYHKDGTKNGLPTPVGFQTIGNLKAFLQRLDEYNVLYTVVNRSDVRELSHDSLEME